jgi:hypothetical protein
MTEPTTPDGRRTTAPLRREAVRRLEKKRGFHAHLLAYVLVNAVLWLVWGALLATADGTGLPWPVFPLLGWGIGLAFHAWDTYGDTSFSEEQIAREAGRLRRRP